MVVYKIDRLSRALMDFAKLVEVFDRNNVTFVSVTQSFNTTTSMGRLTLNILLSFAQFEREVIGERIRDKFAASRKKGMWMGGFVPLGYDVKDRKLVVNEAEAATVRRIFERFRQDRLGDRLSSAQLAEEGVRGKHGKLIDKGYVYQLLQQPGLHRRGGSQGHVLSRRAPGDHQQRRSGTRSTRSSTRAREARAAATRADAGPAEGSDLRPDRLRHDAHPHTQGRQALSLLRRHRRAARAADMPARSGASLRPRSKRPWSGRSRSWCRLRKSSSRPGGRPKRTS